MHSCYNGHSEIVKFKFLLETRPGIYEDNIFYSVCKNGNLKMAKLLLEIRPDFDITINNNDAFSVVCENGHMELAKFLLEIRPDIINSDNFNTFFCDGCENGNLKMVQFLLELKQNINTDTRIDYYTAFCNACEYGHLKVAKWLFELNPNINISKDDDYIFSSVCENGHLKVARWLININRNYKIIVKDDVITKYYVLNKLPIDSTITIDVDKIKDNECPVCYENVVNIQTDCKHNFCEACIIKVYSKSNNCPCCRSTINKFYLVE